MSIWDATRYGFSPVYWVQIAGVPVVLAERETGLALPSGYTSEDASLVIDDSAAIGAEQIDRERGTSVSLSFGFRLLDTATVRAWLRAPSKQMFLAADLTATGTALTVDDTTGWSNGETAYIGMEAVTLGTVASGTSVTGCTRGTLGTYKSAHKVGTTGQIVTDLPRYWRGRDVILWASPCDQSGFVTGDTLAADARMVWRGRIEEGPSREINGFSFDAVSLDRIPDRGLSAIAAGKIVSTSAKVAVSKGYAIKCEITAYKTSGTVWSYILIVHPFKNDATGDLLTHSEIMERIITEWAVAVTDAGAGAAIGALSWFAYPHGAPTAGAYKARLAIVADATIVGFEIFLYLDGQPSTVSVIEKPKTWATGGDLDLGWSTSSNPLQPGQAKEPAVPVAITVEVNDGDASAIAAPGRVRIRTGSATRTLAYKAVSTSGGLAYLTGCVPVDGSAYYPTKPELENADAEILFTDSGALPVMMLRCLMSSGTGERSATYDTLAQAQGYGLHEDLIRADSFTNASAPIGSLKADVAHADRSFADLFGGACGLFRKAVVVKTDADDSYDLKLHLVDTSSFGAGYSTTIADTDLLSDAGDPIKSIKRAHSPNVITVLRPYGGGKDGEDRFLYVDGPGVDSAGRDEVEYVILATDRGALYDVASPAAVSHLAADQTVQAAELRVGPWVVAEQGDVVWLELTHPAVWTWSTSPGSAGYSGAARVVGRTIDPKTTAVTLAVLLDASVQVATLCPAAAVVSYDHATAPTTIDVPLKYLKHFTDALADAGGNVWVLHYHAGSAETVSQRHQISAAAESGSVCRLTVVATSGGHTLSVANKSTLTLPTTSGGDITTWQARFAHVDDGTSWG